MGSEMPYERLFSFLNKVRVRRKNKKIKLKQAPNILKKKWVRRTLRSNKYCEEKFSGTFLDSYLSMCVTPVSFEFFQANLVCYFIGASSLSNMPAWWVIIRDQDVDIKISFKFEFTDSIQTVCKVCKEWNTWFNVAQIFRLRKKLDCTLLM